MLKHKWQPLEGLKPQSSNVDFREIDSLHQQWVRFRQQREESNPDAYRAFLQRVYRTRTAVEAKRGLSSSIRARARARARQRLESRFVPGAAE